MPRIARVILPGLPHHVTQRGNQRQDVFYTDHDRHQYLEWLREYAGQHGLRFWAWCLMSNHVHLIAVPETVDSMAETLRHTHMRHAQRLNWRADNPGHLWQGRYYSCVLSEEHLYRAVRYVENNPVRASLVFHAERYPWSSAGAHINGSRDVLIPPEDPLPKMIGDWGSYLRASENEDTEWLKHFRKCTRSGCPVGSEAFVSDLERKLGRPLRVRPRGRPRKDRVEQQRGLFD